MRFVVRHQTVYRYSVPVALATHWLRLTPRLEQVSLSSRTLHVYPQPATQLDQLDPFANRVTELHFHGSTQLLQIQSDCTLDTLIPSPLQLQPPPLPWNAATLQDGLAPYRVDPAPDASVARFAADLAYQAAHEPLTFLDRLTHALFTRTDRQLRLSGDAQPPALTLAGRLGSCRDLTVLFMAACRCQGIASRFTSGYLAPLDDIDQPRELHAWPEVFIPGAGWRGWDPSIGQRVGDAHVPLCSAPTQSATMPVEGGYFFQGASVTTTLDFDLRIAIDRGTAW